MTFDKDAFIRRVREATYLTTEEAAAFSCEDYADAMDELAWEIAHEADNARRTMALDAALRGRT